MFLLSFQFLTFLCQFAFNILKFKFIVRYCKFVDLFCKCASYDDDNSRNQWIVGVCFQKYDDFSSIIKFPVEVQNVSWHTIFLAVTLWFGVFEIVCIACEFYTFFLFFLFCFKLYAFCKNKRVNKYKKCWIMCKLINYMRTASNSFFAIFREVL